MVSEQLPSSTSLQPVPSETAAEVMSDFLVSANQLFGMLDHEAAADGVSFYRTVWNDACPQRLEGASIVQLTATSALRELRRGKFEQAQFRLQQRNIVGNADVSDDNTMWWCRVNPQLPGEVPVFDYKTLFDGSAYLPCTGANIVNEAVRHAESPSDFAHILRSMQPRGLAMTQELISAILRTTYDHVGIVGADDVEVSPTQNEELLTLIETAYDLSTVTGAKLTNKMTSRLINKITNDLYSPHAVEGDSSELALLKAAIDRGIIPRSNVAVLRVLTAMPLYHDEYFSAYLDTELNKQSTPKSVSHIRNVFGRKRDTFAYDYIETILITRVRDAQRNGSATRALDIVNDFCEANEWDPEAPFKMLFEAVAHLDHEHYGLETSAWDELAATGGYGNVVEAFERLTSAILPDDTQAAGQVVERNTKCYEIVYKILRPLGLYALGERSITGYNASDRPEAPQV